MTEVLNKSDWLSLSRKLDWNFSYVKEEEVFPKSISGHPWYPHSQWESWEEPFKTSYTDYVIGQNSKEDSVKAVHEAVGRAADYSKLPPQWLSVLKLHSAVFSMAEFAAVIGNLRAVRFGRDSAWRMTACFGALDEMRHTQIPLTLMHELVKIDSQFDWAHKLYHTDNWVAIAARHLVNELLLFSDPIEFAVGTNFVFETGLTNLQFVGLSSLAHHVNDKMFEKVLNSIQSDEARHAQVGLAVLKIIVKQDKEYAQFLLDKWFWRSWPIFAFVTGLSMDYFTPLQDRKTSFKEFMQEWIIDQFLLTIQEVGLDLPWYWDYFLDTIDSYHHMLYVDAYTYRSMFWFDFSVPSPEERLWLSEKYPKYWKEFDLVWGRISECWKQADIGNEFAVHGTAIIGFCDLCQVTLSNGTPLNNSVQTLEYQGQKYIFCSEPCCWIFKKQPERYSKHQGLVKRVLSGNAPGNIIALLEDYFNLTYEEWGKDLYQGDYAWLQRDKQSE